MEQITQLLLAALKATVEEVPFLAGSVVPFSKDHPWLRDVRAEGAAYLEVKDLSQQVKYSNLRENNFSPSLLDPDQLCPFPNSVYIQDTPIDVCRLRANFVEDGLLLVISIIHTVCDGHGISDILKIFTDKLRKAEISGLSTVSTSNEDSQSHPHPRSLNRNFVLSGSGFDGAIENHTGWTTSPVEIREGFNGTNTVCTTYRIDNNSLHELKQLASSHSLSSSVSNNKEIQASAQGTKISTHDAVAALIWRSILLARYRAGIISENTTTHFLQAVDCRSRLQLPEPYFGNVIYGVKASLALLDLISPNDSSDASNSAGIQAAAHGIRTEICDATGDKFRDLLAFVEKTYMKVLTRPSVQEDMLNGSIFLVSYWYFGMHELDFGKTLGRTIEAFRLPSRGLLPGMPIVLPRLPDGGCEVMISERESMKKFLDKDEFFRGFVRELC